MFEIVFLWCAVQSFEGDKINQCGIFHTNRTYLSERACNLDSEQVKAQTVLSWDHDNDSVLIIQEVCHEKGSK